VPISPRSRRKLAPMSAETHTIPHRQKRHSVSSEANTHCNWKNTFLWPPYMEYGRPLYFRPVVSSSFFFFFLLSLAYSQPSQIGRAPHMCGISANLECRSEMCFGPLAAEIGSGVWGTPANFNGFRVLPSSLQRRRLSEANQTLHDVWPSPGLVS